MPTFVLRGKTTSRRDVDEQDRLALELLERKRPVGLLDLGKAVKNSNEGESEKGESKGGGIATG